MVTISDNIFRLLRHYNLQDSITMTGGEKDRIYGLVNSGRLLEFVIENNWTRCPGFITSKFHGDGNSYREPGAVSPALQIVFHELDKPLEWIEIDFDYYNPKGGDLVSLFGHFGEVLYNKILKMMTSQEKVSRLLDKRGIDQ